MSIEWKSWCRLCGCKNNSEIDVFIKDENFFSLSEKIQLFLSITICDVDEAPKKICNKCETLLSELVTFSMKATKVQEMYAELQSNDKFEMFTNFEKLRENYGLSIGNDEEFITTNNLKNNILDETHSYNNDGNDVDDDQQHQSTKRKKSKRIAKTKIIKSAENVQQSSDAKDGILNDDSNDDDNQQHESTKRKRSKRIAKIKLIKSVENVQQRSDAKDGILNDDNNDDDYQQHESTKRNRIAKTKIVKSEENVPPSLDAKYGILNDDNNDDDYQQHQSTKIIEKTTIIKLEENEQQSSDGIFNDDNSNNDSYSSYNDDDDDYRPHISKKKLGIAKTTIIKSDKKNENDKSLPKVFDGVNQDINNISIDIKTEQFEATTSTTNKEESFICEECGKSFPTSDKFNSHKIVHIDKYPFQCTQCPKKFKRLQSLKNHLDCHADTKYICPVCGLKLNTKPTLRIHMIVHSDVKKHKCHLCLKEFKRSRSLKTHLILHEGIKPYQCPYCDRTFAAPSNCRKHQKLKHAKELAEAEEANNINITKNIPNMELLKPVNEDEEAILNNKNS